jgi:hypothetical protein
VSKLSHNGMAEKSNVTDDTDGFTIGMKQAIFSETGIEVVWQYRQMQVQLHHFFIIHI